MSLRHVQDLEHLSRWVRMHHRFGSPLLPVVILISFDMTHCRKARTAFFVEGRRRAVRAANG